GYCSGDLVLAPVSGIARAVPPALASDDEAPRTGLAQWLPSMHVHPRQEYVLPFDDVRLPESWQHAVHWDQRWGDFVCRCHRLQVGALIAPRPRRLSQGHVASVQADQRHPLHQKGASHYSYGDRTSLIGRNQTQNGSTRVMAMRSNTGF